MIIYKIKFYLKLRLMYSYFVGNLNRLKLGDKQKQNINKFFLENWIVHRYWTCVRGWTSKGAQVLIPLS